MLEVSKSHSVVSMWQVPRALEARSCIGRPQSAGGFCGYNVVVVWINEDRLNRKWMEAQHMRENELWMTTSRSDSIIEEKEKKREGGEEEENCSNALIYKSMHATVL